MMNNPALLKARSNRTFMELKSYCQSVILCTFFVLIVPLWNWNVYTAEQMVEAISSNRTFMELKYVTFDFFSFGTLVLIVPLWNWNAGAPVNVGALAGSNRTFMELKFEFDYDNHAAIWF